MRPLKRRILSFIARFGGKLMFAALRPFDVKGIEVYDATTKEMLLELPQPEPLSPAQWAELEARYTKPAPQDEPTKPLPTWDDLRPLRRCDDPDPEWRR
jgi:hypothetical protein